MSVRKDVACTQCGNKINRVTWNYGKNRPITAFFCDNVCKGQWQKAQREALGYTREWLESEYIQKGRSANDIAREIGRDSKRVWEWIKDYGLPTKPRGNFYGQGFVEGGKSPFLGAKHSDKTKEKIRQARIRDGRIPCIKDGVHWMHHPDYNGKDHPNWKGGLTPERQAFYSSQEWCEAVKAVWARDNATCQRCGKHHNTAQARGTFHIHHIISFQHKAYRADVDNLLLVCKECHRWIHSKKNKSKQYIKEIINDRS